MLNTTRLRILREIAGHGSIAGAAESLWLTPSAVSQQVAALEREIGTPLLVRTPRSVRLTDAGVRLVAHAERILADCEAAVADIAALSGDVTGTLHISAFPTAAQALLVPAMAGLKERYPSLTVLATDLEPHEAMPALKAGQLDLVISHEYSLLPRYSDPGIEVTHLLTERMMLIVPAAHPKAAGRARLADFADERWIVGREATFCRELVVRAANVAGFEPTIEMQSNDFRVIACAVRAGLGVALVPRIADLRGIDGLSLRALDDPAVERRIFAAVRNGSSGSPALAAVLDALSREAAAEGQPPTGRGASARSNGS
jgi:DNA-binding transcriptional LysR family regulator